MTERCKPDLRIRSPKYQPTKAELEEDMRIDATPEELVPARKRRLERLCGFRRVRLAG